MAIARFPTFVYDCPDAAALAAFYAALLDHMAGDPEATDRLVTQAGWLMDRICPQR